MSVLAVVRRCQHPYSLTLLLLSANFIDKPLHILAAKQLRPPAELAVHLYALLFIAKQRELLATQRDKSPLHALPTAGTVPLKGIALQYLKGHLGEEK
jgi:hypothetical protein